MFGGGTKSFLTLFEGLCNKGIEPTIVLPDNNGLYKYLTQKGFKTLILPIRFSTYPRTRNITEILLFPLRLLYWQYCNFISVKRLVRLLQDDRPDIIHTNVSVVDVGLRVAQKLGVSHIYHFREYADKDFGLKYFPSPASFYNMVKLGKSYSICITKDNQRHHRLQDNPYSKVIYDGVLPASNIEKDFVLGDYFLYVGRIEPTKGLMELLIAYKSYSESVSNTFVLKVAGEVVDENYYKEITRYITQHKLSAYVVFVGQRDDVLDLYREARAVIVPSRFEGFGRCMPEAMFQGTIVIGHDTGGTKEQFDNGVEYTSQEIGLRYDSINELLNHLIFMHNATEQDVSDMRLRAYDTVNKLYSIENNVEAVESFYKDIINDEHN